MVKKKRKTMLWEISEYAYDPLNKKYLVFTDLYDSKSTYIWYKITV